MAHEVLKKYGFPFIWPKHGLRSKTSDILVLYHAKHAPMVQVIGIPSAEVKVKVGDTQSFGYKSCSF